MIAEVLSDEIIRMLWEGGLRKSFSPLTIAKAALLRSHITLLRSRRAAQ
jgi:hypothetical protein